MMKNEIECNRFYFIRYFYLAVFSILFASSTTTAQTFTKLAGSDNPFDGIGVGEFSTPVLADLDNDGDGDLFVGAKDGTIHFYRNDGSAVSPSFTSVTGTDNPFDGVDVGRYSAICFGDIDHDGDLDAFIGEEDGGLYFYQNDGDFDTPVFNELTGTSNPLDGVLHNYSSPRFMDLDCDGDLDICIADAYGRVRYYENTGTPLAPTYVQKTTADNPFYTIGDMGNFVTVEVADLDQDGDADAFMGNGNGSIYYGENSGNAVASNLALVSGSGSPFDGITVGNASYVTLYDLDSDGDLDAIIGKRGGDIFTYANGTSTLPVSMVSFTADFEEDRVVLNWETATEVNNYGFDVERALDSFSSNGDSLSEYREWVKIGFVPGGGTSNSSKSYNFIDDNISVNNDYAYRLKQIDNDGKFEYWDVIHVSSVILDVEADLPDQFAVNPNYPNPFNPSTVINYQIPKEGLVTVKIYDALGRKVQTLVQENETAGTHSVNFDASAYSSGVFLYTVAYDGFVAVGKMLYLQ